MLASGSSDGEEDGEESSSLHNMKDHFKSALDEFRENWQKELKNEPMPLSQTKGRSDASQLTSNLPDESDEQRAERLFRYGVELEKGGKVYDALKFYRKAVQIVPDIEFKFYEKTKAQQLNQVNDNKEGTSLDADADATAPNLSGEDLTNINLFLRFQSELTQSGRFIGNSTDAGVLTTSTHISNLPTEIILYILRWVVSSQLDARSLEQCAATCKGLYLCARDEEIWRQACLKVWGANTGSLSKSRYNSWRQMFIERERIQFNGCYISKNTYIRYGENSFQDEFYRPIQLIEYYRYFRFFPDGTVLTMTNSDEPSQGVAKLKNLANLRADILRGHYKLHGNIVTVMLTKQQPKWANLPSKRRGSLAEFDGGCSSSTNFYIEFDIVNTTKRKFCQLQWMTYSLIQKRNKKEIVTDFELNSTKFPALWFSRVKSYHLEADAPLQ